MIINLVFTVIVAFCIGKALILWLHPKPKPEIIRHEEVKPASFFSQQPTYVSPPDYTETLIANLSSFEASKGIAGKGMVNDKGSPYRTGLADVAGEFAGLLGLK